MSMIGVVISCKEDDDCGKYTRDNCRINADNYELIVKGMTKDEVMKILGKSSSYLPASYSQNNLEHHLWYRYSYLERAPKVNLLSISVDFKDDVVVDKKMDK